MPMFTLEIEWEAEKALCSRTSLREWMHCRRKIRYGHEETAEKACTVMEVKTGEDFDAYHCDYCDGWHIGHRRAAA